MVRSCLSSSLVLALELLNLIAVESALVEFQSGCNQNPIAECICCLMWLCHVVLICKVVMLLHIWRVTKTTNSKAL
jgi:hypothetical protein